jgi:hypothetical protein
VRYRGPLPKRAIGRVNACVLTLRSSPRWGRVISLTGNDDFSSGTGPAVSGGGTAMSDLAKEPSVRSSPGGR